MSPPPARHRTRTVRSEGASRVGRGNSITFSQSAEAALKSANSQVIEDPFKSNYLSVAGELNVIQPPYNIAALHNMPDENSMLRQCIDAMVTNTEGHGWRLEYVGPEDQEDSDAAKAEKRKIEQFLKHPNPDMSFTETRGRLRRDLETTGCSAFEVLRQTGSVEVVSVNHVPFTTLRMTAKDRTNTTVEVMVAQDDGTYSKIVMQKKFRRFVQRAGSNVVYFKEFGDPRVIRSDTGAEDNSCPEALRATEVFVQTLYSPKGSYGVPRWINQLPAILGSRQAELTNLDFFRENAIPAMVVMVSGGRLTQASLDQIEEQVSGARGRQSMNRVVVLEAIGDDAAKDDKGTIPPPKVDLKPMAGDRQKEGYFLEYGADCDKKVRSSFRLPPIFVGQSEDYSHATAKASYEVAESQVFGPARQASDDIFNTHILATYQPRFWALRSNPPKISDPEEVIAALEAFSNMGALSPNKCIDLANEYFDLELPKIEADWGDYPFALVEILAQAGTLTGIEDIEDPEKAPGANTAALDPVTGQPLPPKVGPKPTKPKSPKAGPKQVKVPGVQPGTPKQPVDKAAVQEALEVLRYAVAGVAMQTHAESAPEGDQTPAVVEQHV